MAQHKGMLSINKSSPSADNDTQSWRYFDVQKEPGLLLRKDAKGMPTF